MHHSESLQQTVDLVGDSTENLLAICFSKTRSPSYPLAVSIARGALKYQELVVGRETVHLAVFERNAEGAKRATALLRYIHEWKATQVYAGGRSLGNSWNALAILECYAVALAARDHRAHCCVVMDDPFAGLTRGSTVTLTLGESDTSRARAVDLYLFPCKHLMRYFRFQEGHPSSVSDQIQAAAVEHCCDWCPLFDADGYHHTGHRRVVS